MDPENTVPTQFLVLFREPDGRLNKAEPAFARQHQQDWKLGLSGGGNGATWDVVGRLYVPASFLAGAFIPKSVKQQFLPFNTTSF
ncbi:hypothetical protein [Spirosoma jeollabukense]